MGIAISPSSAQTEPLKTPRLQPTVKALNTLKKQPTEVTTQGDIFTFSAIHLKALSLKELQYETIQVDTSKYTYVSHSDGTNNEPNRLVVIRDPEHNGNYITLELSKTNIDRLKQKFGDDTNFFERADGVLRLNGDAEAYVAGWLHNITIDRNYAKADADGNGLVEHDEMKALTIGFGRQSNYDYIGKKIVKINLDTGEKYQEMEQVASHLFGDKDDKLKYQLKRSATNANYIQFENSVEKELDHTIKMDTDLNGTLSLKEGLVDEFGKDYHKKVISDMELTHKDVLYYHPELNDDTKLQNYTLATAPVLSKEEAAKALEAFYEQARKDALYMSTADLFKMISENDITSTLKQLEMQTAKSTDASEEEDSVTKEARVSF